MTYTSEDEDADCKGDKKPTIKFIVKCNADKKTKPNFEYV